MKFSRLIVSHSENTQKEFRFFFSILLVFIISTSIGFSQCNSDSDCGNGFACIPPLIQWGKRLLQKKKG